MTSTRAVVRRLDHVPLVVDDPHMLYEVFTDALALPKRPWPGLSEPPDRLAGPDDTWVTLGDIDLFFFQAKGRVAPGVKAPVIGIGFEPEPISEAIAELDRRGIAHYDLVEEIEEPGAVRETWSILRGFFENRQAYVFIAELEYEDGWSPEAVRAQRRSIFDASGGGSLALDGAAELVIGARALDQALQRWQTLLDPLIPNEPGLWHFADGPSLRVVENDRDQVLCLKLRTRDLERASEVLHSFGLLAGTSPGEIALLPESFSGVDLRLVSS